MNKRSHPVSRLNLSFSFMLFALFVAAIWLAGGSSRGDAAGQVVVRWVSWTALGLVVLIGRKPSLANQRPILILLAAAIVLTLLHLVPLPPELWRHLSGRDLLDGAWREFPAVWRPLSMAPAATLNAAMALVVPMATWVLLASLGEADRDRLPALLLIAIVASMFVGLLQFSGAWFNNPFVKSGPDQVSGMFANRNHFALLLAIGCIVAPAWAFSGIHRSKWREPLALGLIPLFLLMILASGSRAGVVLGGLALIIGLALVHQGFQRRWRHVPSWKIFGIGAAIGILSLALIVLSITADRAVAINRVFEAEAVQDMRQRSLPTLISMTVNYMPFGSGVGTFDPVFRLSEPPELLKPTYFNHAHNDLLEVVIDGGLPGLSILIGAFGWWLWASIRAWRGGLVLPKLGSSILFLTLVASAFDYPVRTPMMMMVVTIAAVWLAARPIGREASPLPRQGLHL